MHCIQCLQLPVAGDEVVEQVDAAHVGVVRRYHGRDWNLNQEQFCKFYLCLPVSFHTCKITYLQVLLLLSAVSAHGVAGVGRIPVGGGIYSLIVFPDTQDLINNMVLVYLDVKKRICF